MRTFLSAVLLAAAIARAEPPAESKPAASPEGTVPAPGRESSIPPNPVQAPPGAPPAPGPGAPPAVEVRPPGESEPPATGSDSALPGLAPDEAPTPDQPGDAPVVVQDIELRTTDADQQRLVSGAPLYNPNVNVHIVQKKPFADEGRHEFVLYPAVVQLNSKFTRHAGTALQYVYHLQENFGLQLAAQYNWYSNESNFNLELIDKVREQAQAASSLLLNWGLQAGVEVTPLYGKFAFYDDKLAQFSLVLSGAAGVGSTRHLIRPQVTNQVDGQSFLVPARFGDTGMKFLGSVGGGFRLQFGDSYSVRMEVRDLVYTARVDKVDGCNLADFEAMERARSSGDPFEGLGLSGSCKSQKFDGIDPRTRKNYREDIILGRDLVAEPSSDVLNNVSFYAGFSILF
ncbi:outer membrane beta-barrel domain-containing protein [Myxococcaceae bacterium GXIMD 01537]